MIDYGKRKKTKKSPDPATTTITFQWSIDVAKSNGYSRKHGGTAVGDADHTDPLYREINIMNTMAAYLDKQIGVS